MLLPRRYIISSILILGGYYGCDEAPTTIAVFDHSMDGSIIDNRPFDRSFISDQNVYENIDLFTQDHHRDEGLLDEGIDMSDAQREELPLDDMDILQSRVSFVENYWSATHNSYEGGQRGSVIEQLESGVRALEYDIHDNDFLTEGYRIGHFQPGNAVDYEQGNPSTDRLVDWLDVINEWSSLHDHAPILLTIDLKDNLTDNQNYDEGNLAHLNHLLHTHIDQIWSPHMGLDDVSLARNTVLCVLSGDALTRQAYLHDQGRSPALSINENGQVLEVHDSGSGDLWYWSGAVSVEKIVWKRHGRYDSGRRPMTLLNDMGGVIEVHQSELRNRLWASLGSVSNDGELVLERADDFSDGAQPSLQWRNAAEGLFSLRYERNGNTYERHGSAVFPNGGIRWESEVILPETEVLFEGSIQSFQGKVYTVSDDGADSEYPSRTLWLNVSDHNRPSKGSPIRYEQLCFVEWQRQEYTDELMGKQAFGALPGSSYGELPSDIRESKVIRGWQYQNRTPDSTIPQVPSTDTPNSESYQLFVQSLNVVE